MEIKTIHQNLVDIQQTLKVAKNQKNTFGNYNYRSCEDILEAVKPLLDGCTLTLQDEVVNVGNYNYVKATATLANDRAEVIQSSAYAREAEDKKGMDDAQITGACSSYARKYALNGLFAIDDTKDADTMDNTKEATKEEPQKPPVIYASLKQVKYIAMLLDMKGQKDEDLKSKYKVTSKKDLTAVQATQIIENLLKLPDVEVPETQTEPEVDVDEVAAEMEART